MGKSLIQQINTLKNRIDIFKAIPINRPRIFVCSKDQSPTKMTTVLLSGNEATKSQAQSFCNEETEAQSTGAAQQKGQPGTRHCVRNSFLTERMRGLPPKSQLNNTGTKLSLTPYMTLLTKVISYKIQMQK